jgi:hypothetical protein
LLELSLNKSRSNDKKGLGKKLTINIVKNKSDKKKPDSSP